VVKINPLLVGMLLLPSGKVVVGPYHLFRVGEVEPILGEGEELRKFLVLGAVY
jgi:hypothetical protein